MGSNSASDPKDQFWQLPYKITKNSSKTFPRKSYVTEFCEFFYNILLKVADVTNM